MTADGYGTAEIMRATGKAKTVIWRWQERFRDGGAAGLWRDKTRPSRIPPLSPAVAERVVAMTLAGPPPAASHWTGAAMAKAAGISVSSVQRIWRAHGLRPHLVRRFKLSNDPQFAAKLKEVVGLYVNPPDHAVVLAVDEKSQIQALDRTQPGLPMKKGRAGTMTHDYKRNGTTTLFAALNMLDGKVIGECMPRHRHREFLRFLKLIDKSTPANLDLHLIVDNYSTHKTAAVAQIAQALPPPFHSDVGFLAQYGRALLCRDHPQTHPSGGVQECPRAEGCHHGLPCSPQFQPQTLLLDRLRRGNPRKGGPWETSVGIGTLVVAAAVAATAVAEAG